jgi:hypothetical protein
MAQHSSGLKMLSNPIVKSAWAQAMFGAPPELEQTGVVTPLKSVFAPKSCCVPPRGIIGSRQLVVPVAIKVGLEVPAGEQPRGILSH